MRNFGLLKSIVENAFITTYKTDEFKRIVKEFKELVSNNKFVGEVFVDYGTIMKTNGLNEDIAKDFLEYSVDNIKSKIEKNKRQFEEFDAWVETLNNSVENQYQDIDNIINAKNASDFISLVESKNKLKKSLTTKTETKENQLTETINIPVEDMFKVVSETFAKEYGELSESELFELKSILKMNKEDLNEGISRLKKEVLNKLDSVNVDDDSTRKTIEQTKLKVESTLIDSLSYYRLKKLSEGL
jgi:uncharacterized membrane-anchored protein YhcB (DUF1043 family)